MPHKLELVLYLFCLFKPRAAIAHCPMWPLPYLPELRWRTHSNESTLSLVSLWHYSCHAAVQLTLRCRSMILILLLHVYITRQFYCQLPVLANSNPVAGHDKFQYLQIPPLLPLLANSLPANSMLGKKLFYFQIPVLANSCQAYLLSESSTCNFHYLQIHTTRKEAPTEPQNVNIAKVNSLQLRLTTTSRPLWNS